MRIRFAWLVYCPGHGPVLLSFLGSAADCCQDGEAAGEEAPGSWFGRSGAEGFSFNTEAILAKTGAISERIRVGLGAAEHDIRIGDRHLTKAHVIGIRHQVSPGELKRNGGASAALGVAASQRSGRGIVGAGEGRIAVATGNKRSIVGHFDTEVAALVVGGTGAEIEIRERKTGAPFIVAESCR